MDLREKLRARPDVPDEEVDDVIALASQLQEEARRPATTGASVAEVQAVAAELDIAPEFVEQAIGQRRREAEQQVARAATARRRLRRLLALAVAAVAVVAMGIGVGAWQGSAGLEPARSELSTARTALDVALERQADLGTQLVALGGADGGELAPLREQVRDADTLEDKRIAGDRLAEEVAARLGQLPPPADENEARLRLDLQYEVAGSQNRVATEERRYREALQAFDEAASSPLARLALGLGVARDPR